MTAPVSAHEYVLVFDGKTTRLQPAPPPWAWDLLVALTDLEDELDQPPPAAPAIAA